MKVLFVFLLTIFLTHLHGQTISLSVGKEINRIDSVSRKQGLFIVDDIVWTNFENGLTITHYGFYLNDKPVGLFETKIKSNGVLIRTKIYFNKNFKETYYYPNGAIAKIGYYKYKKNKKVFTEDLGETMTKTMPFTKGGFSVKWVYFGLSCQKISETEFRAITSNNFSYLRNDVNF